MITTAPAEIPTNTPAPVRPAGPTTGPESILAALKAMDVDALEKEQHEIIRSGSKTKRGRAVRILNIVQGLKRNDVSPDALMIHSVPVIPPKFRPFSLTGNTFLPGDSNEVYRDVLEYRRLYDQTHKVLGQDGAADAYLDLNKAVRAAYGYGESPNPKTKARQVKGFFDMVSGVSPKFSWYQSRMISKPVDTVGRGVIIPDADMGMDDVGLPEDMAWKLYGNYVQRRLVRSGMAPAAAMRHMDERTTVARKALDTEMGDEDDGKGGRHARRPVIITRSPAWHRTNVIGQRAQIVPGDAIRVNTFITEGQNADFDGDTMSVHVPSTDAAIRDVRDKMMASKMLWSIKDREKTMANPKHEMLIGVNMTTPEGVKQKRHKFNSADEAHAAIERGEVDLYDDVEVAQ